MEVLKQFLSSYKRSKISLLQLVEQCPTLQYEQFAQILMQLERENILTSVKASGMNGKQPPLANTYKINKTMVLKGVREQVIQLKKSFHAAIWIEYYLTKTIQELEQDLPALQQLNTYLQNNPLPERKALAQERSFEIFNNEKFITEQGGKQLLEKVKVWELLEIWPIADPVSYAINPFKLNDEHHKFLIVENKATFYSLLPALKESVFSALLYGQGNAINGTIQVLKEQLPLNYENVQFYYFGDLDAEGISIWYLLQQKIHAQLALPFYRACLQKKAAKGKEYQRKNAAAIEAFVHHFDEETKGYIGQLLQEGFYFPQEILKADELQRIWRDAVWTKKI